MHPRLVSLAFLAFLIAVPLWDVTRPGALDWGTRVAALLRTRATPVEADVFSRWFPWTPPGSAFEDFERRLEEASAMRRGLRPRVQRFLTQVCRLGNSKVIVAPDGALLHRPGFEFVVGRAPEQVHAPADAILRWNEELSRLGIELLVVPVPPKAARFEGAFVRNAAWEEFVGTLTDHGVSVLEVEPTYLRTDTHWTPSGMAAAAAAIAEVVLERGWVERGPRSYASAIHEVERVGDLGRLLDARAEARWLTPDVAEIRSVTDWEPDPSSRVLLLGDSFTNIYSLGGMGWGTRAGLAEELSLRLGLDVDRIALNGDGARASRDALRLAGPGRLDGKRVVIFQFAARELSLGDWSPLATR